MPTSYFSDEIAYTAINLAFDGFIFAFTVHKTWSHVLESRRLGHTGVTYIFLRDGAYHHSFALYGGRLTRSLTTGTIHFLSVVDDDMTTRKHHLTIPKCDHSL